MATTTLQPSLPGVRFQVVVPQPQEALPRMDIAAFAGFAAAGPVDVPVPVEDVPTFRAWFGPDLELAVDPENGRIIHSQLGQTVEAFFRNGGRRCWVLRLAGSDEELGFPATNTFLVPGLVKPGTGSPLRLVARSPGSWSDGLRVGATETRESLDGDFDASSPEPTIVLSSAAPAVEPEDVLRVVFAEGQLLVRVNSVETQEDGTRLVEWTQSLWLRESALLEPPGAGGQVWIPDASALTPVPVEVGSAGDAIELVGTTETGLVEHLAPGSVLRFELEGSPSSQGYVVVGQVGTVATDTESPEVERVELRLEAVFWELDDATARAELASAGTVRIERLQFGLTVWEGEEVTGTIAQLECSSARDRFWGNLPDDRALFRMVKGELPETESGSLASEAKGPPRFPLAAPDDKSLEEAFFPIGLPEMAAAERSGPAWVVSGSPLERDGLAAFEGVRFTDPSLADLGVTTVVREANHRRFVLDQDLAGLHALLPFEEITLVAIPDATHRAWQDAVAAEREALGTPQLAQAGDRVWWSGVEDAEGYEVEEAWDVEFQRVIRTVAQEDSWIQVVAPEACAEATFYRVRATRPNVRSGPWSATLIVSHRTGGFRACEEVPLPAAPQVESVTEEVDGLWYVSLTWAAVNGADAYEIQRAADEDFLATTSVLQVSGTTTGTAAERVEVAAYFRVRSLTAPEDNPVKGPWSNTVVVEPPPVAEGRELVLPDAYDELRLIEIHTALVRFCAARGDLLALLSLPTHYHAEDARAYQEQLRAELEDAAESYGALYHPWLWTVSEDAEIAEARLLAPEGAVAGVFARRARARGAWIAPANEGLRAVVGVEPLISRAEWETLFAAQVNLVRDDPRGFLPLSAYTLSEETDLRHVNVRRLMTLLRRIVWREGNRLVFQPNSFRLRARIRDEMTRMLELLYQRGAFAGSRPAEAYQVITDASANPPESVDLGRLIVEIQVAPARPMQFLTVRLVQEGLESLTLESS